MIDIEKLVKDVVEKVVNDIIKEQTSLGNAVSSEIEKGVYTPPVKGRKVVVTAEEVIKAFKSKKDIEVPAGSIITPLAYDTAFEKGVKIIINNKIMAGANGTSPKGAKQIAIGSDHGGYKLKEAIKDYLYNIGYIYKDYGTHSTASVDYPDYAAAVAKAVASGECDLGIVIDGAGIGSAIAANKIKGILAAVCHDKFTARIAREHDNANILAIGSFVLNEFQAKEVVRTFLITEFAGGRHARRIDKIFKLENGGT